MFSWRDFFVCILSLLAFLSSAFADDIQVPIYGTAAIQNFDASGNIIPLSGGSVWDEAVDFSTLSLPCVTGPSDPSGSLLDQIKHHDIQGFPTNDKNAAIDLLKSKILENLTHSGANVFSPGIKLQGGAFVTPGGSELPNIGHGNWDVGIPGGLPHVQFDVPDIAVDHPSFPDAGSISTDDCGNKILNPPFIHRNSFPEMVGSPNSDPRTMPDAKVKKMVVIASIFPNVQLKLPDDSETIQCDKAYGTRTIPEILKDFEVATRQFSEVVEIAINRGDGSETEYCSGSLIAPNWVLTAGHCFYERKSRDTLDGDWDADYVKKLNPGDPYSISVVAKNAALPDAEKQAAGIQFVIHQGYNVSGTVPQYDYGLIELSPAFDPRKFEIAELATTQNPVSTLGGYGYNDKNGGHGDFLVGFPPLLQWNGLNIRSELSTAYSALCQGDSGGPVFSGINRGCRKDDPAGEERPRKIQGIISSNVLRPNAHQADACKAARRMAMMDVTSPEIHQWICKATSNALPECK